MYGVDRAGIPHWADSPKPDCEDCAHELDNKSGMDFFFEESEEVVCNFLTGDKICDTKESPVAKAEAMLHRVEAMDHKVKAKWAGYCVASSIGGYVSGN